MKTLKTCLIILCLLHVRAVGLPQFGGATSFCMKQIPLSRGKFALVDDEYFNFLNQWKWWTKECKTSFGSLFYAVRTEWIEGGKGKTKTHLMHRVLMDADSSTLVDHRDHNGLNNQKTNLRKCSKGQNNSNRRSVPLSSSKYLGVSFDKQSSKWYACISLNNRTIAIGLFYNEKEAALAYNKKAIELKGEFANLNKV